MLKLAILIAVISVIALSIISWWGGTFDSVALKMEITGPYHLVYRQYKGPYAGSRYLLKSVVSYLREKKSLVATRGFSIFYDDPSRMSPEDLRCSAGVVVDSVFDVDSTYIYAQFEKTNALTGTFPIRSYFSYVIGLYKFHKALNRYCKNVPCEIVKPILEIYDMNTMEITYIAPVGRKTSPAPRYTTR